MADDVTLITVTRPSGEVETVELAADEYVVICGDRREETARQDYPNGTSIVTIKAKPDPNDQSAAARLAQLAGRPGTE